MTTTYTVKEIFATIQGEGYHAGKAAVFVRLAGCNMWSGIESKREADANRTLAECPKWCDTDFRGGDHMTARQIADIVAGCGGGKQRLVVISGGEPLLQVDDELLLAIMGSTGAMVAIETNGTVAPRFDPMRVWITMSPKVGRHRIMLERADEIKVVVPAYAPDEFADFPCSHRFVQAMDPSLMRGLVSLSGRAGFHLASGDMARRNYLSDAAEYVMDHPEWRLSVQTHKVVGVP